MLPSVEVSVELAGLILMIPIDESTSGPMPVLPAERRMFSARLRASLAASASISNLSDPNIANPVLVIDPLNYLGQTLNTAANSLYTLSFWVGETGDGPSGFSIFWDGQRVAEKLNPANNTLGPNGSGMVQYLFSDLMAAGALTSFEIHGRQDRAKIYFDDVSVLAVENINSVPEPSSLALIGLGLAGLAFVKRRKA